MEVGCLVSSCASRDRVAHIKEDAAVQGDDERPGLLGYCQGNIVLVLLLSQRYLKQPHSIVMLESC